MYIASIWSETGLGELRRLLRQVEAGHIWLEILVVWMRRHLLNGRRIEILDLKLHIGPLLLLVYNQQRIQESTSSLPDERSSKTLSAVG